MTMPATEADRIRSYLIAQANKLSLAELVERGTQRRDAQDASGLLDVLSAPTSKAA